MTKANYKKKQQLKNVGTATALTITLATSNVPTLAYAMELKNDTNEEVVVEETVEEVVVEEEKKKKKVTTQEEISIQEGADTQEKEITTQEEVVNVKSTDKQSTGNQFNLNDWEYNSYISTIVLTKYKGTSTDIVIPGKVQAPAGTNPQGQPVPEGLKEVKIGTMDSVLSNECFAGYRDKITSLKFIEVEGKKPQLPTPSNGTINNAFKNFTSLKTIDLSGMDISRVTSINKMFEGCTSLENVNLSGATISSLKESTMSGIFEGFNNLKKVDLSNINTNNIESMYNMFKGCTSLESINLQGLNTSGITNMTGMFLGCSKLYDIKFDNVFDTSNAKTMNNMFKDCSSLKDIDLSNFDTSAAINMSYMFSDSGVESLDLSNFNTEQVTDMTGMFRNTRNLTDITFGTNFKTNNVTKMPFMFCNSNVESLDLSNFETSQVLDMTAMFGSLDNISVLNLSNFVLNPNVNMHRMFARHISVESANANIIENQDESLKKVLVVVATDKKLKAHNYIDDYCLPVGLTLDAVGGQFTNDEEILELKTNVVETLDENVINKEIENVLENIIPTKDGHEFVAWREVEPKATNFAINKTYYAEWAGTPIAGPEDKPVDTTDTPTILPDDVPVDTTDTPATLPDDVPVDTDDIPTILPDDVIIEPDTSIDPDGFKPVEDGTHMDDNEVDEEDETPDVEVPPSNDEDNNSQGNTDEDVKLPIDNENQEDNNGNSSNESTSNSGSNNNPQTGDVGVLGSIGLGLTSILGIFINNRKKKK